MNGTVTASEYLLRGTIAISEYSLSGTLSSSSHILRGSLHADNLLVGSLSKPIAFEYYLGEYNITPKTEETVMNTADKQMINDVVVRKIPYYETSNLSGGDTVYIGTEVKIDG